jgi:hypothetical protein
MGDYRHTETGEVKSQGEWRRHYKNTSLPRTWTAATLQGLNLEAVLEAPKPTAGQYQTVARNGVEQDANGNWITAWAVRDMFADDAESTKAEKEAAYQAQLDSVAAEQGRAKRNKLLTASDWTQMNDSPLANEMKTAWATYRQELRDVTDLANWPNIAEDDWPIEP